MEVDSKYKDHFIRVSENVDIAMQYFESKGVSSLYSALIDLLKEARRENQRLLSSLNSLTLASLSVRNLFEIYLISKHIYTDKKALFNWHGQSHKDSKEVRDGAIVLMKKNGLDTKELEDMQKFEDDSLEASPFESKGGFQIRNLADKYGYIDDYYFIYKLSSKIIHPSSMKVMTYDVLTENTNYLSIVLQVGMFFSNKYSEFLQMVINERN